ncbi:MAG: hypothetical protein BGO98_24560 [Myxococcales bacterium 68-20]|nr:hypothetical protein [Myxococcales bacterium]OJY15841.1 MAG: hypothetical protein BGO98_24560 [Myxococcales bacterium 68-20]
MQLRLRFQSVSRPLTVALATTTLLVCWASGCSSYDDRIGLLAPEPPSFTNADASASAAEPEAGLTAYCPATTCLAPFTTCPGSRFACDVNVMTDPENCGSCGFRCPSDRPGASFTCVAGTCVMECIHPTRTRDCNGILDDDCEVILGTNDNCTACGDTCPDPAKPCIYDYSTGVGKCGCGVGSLFCGSGGCIDPNTSDVHCGGCGNACDPSGGGGERRAHTYYGCSGGTCGHLKCESLYADCDQDVTNGCEASLLSPTSCGGCGIVCDANQACLRNANGVPECLCPPGQTRCGSGCTDLRSDAANCGSCGMVCSQASGWTTGVAVCSYGSCRFQCAQGRGDCNGDLRDGCETNLDSDPRNCGACGNSCEPGQPCMAGRCAVVPCDEAGETR